MPLLGHILANSHEGFSQHFRIDHGMGIDRFGMNIGTILAFLDIDPPLVKRDGIDLAELLATDIAEFFITAQLGLLWRKAVTVNRCSFCSTRRANEIQPCDSQLFRRATRQR